MSWFGFGGKKKKQKPSHQQPTPIMTDEKKGDNKYDDDSDNEHDFQEVVVNGSDYRKEVYRFVSIRNLQIIKCIGQIAVEYNYQIKHEYKESGVGTGTVYRVTNGGAAFIITCAHNVRHRIAYCSNCDTYNPRKKKCSKCYKRCDKKKIIKPTSIEFHRYTITDEDFAHLEDTYDECHEIYVSEAYDEHRYGEKGFDFAILMIRDHEDGYYAKNCHNIQLAVGTEILKQYKRFSIFGYPGKDYENVKKDELWGYAMKSDADEKGVEIVECDQSYGIYQRKTEYTLRQRHVDASPGQSGSVVFVKANNNDAVIFAVHVGGHSKDNSKHDDYAFNRATLLSSKYIRIMAEVTQDKYSEDPGDVYDFKSNFIYDEKFGSEDSRVPVYASKYKLEPIMNCIGEIRCSYQYDEHSFVKTAKRTGTVFTTNPDMQKAFIIADAYAARLKIEHCVNCDKYYYVKPRQKICVHCGSGELKIKIISANRIHFRRKSVQKNNYGDLEKSYPVKVEYIDNRCGDFLSATSGYNWGLYSFIDTDDYYSQYTKNIQIKTTIKTLTKCNSFSIYGFDPLHEFKLYGATSIGNNYTIAQSKHSGKYYLMQREIFCSLGQGGSAVWTKDENNGVIYIFAITKDKKKWGGATIITNDILDEICCHL